jgi:hypothetical protein
VQNTPLAVFGMPAVMQQACGVGASKGVVHDLHQQP